jgi:TetR/AcrR family transcriptional regulator, regulator of cefoperazone and chloramphenicol sensitivity
MKAELGALPSRPIARAATSAAPGPEDARQRLLAAGLRLFAQQGFSKTSTRELAEAANVNVASISYYFGDKAGLYRAAFMEPLGSPADDIARFTQPGQTLAQTLHEFFDGFLEPLRHGDTARLCVKLHFREMLEPTGLWQEEVAQGIAPLQEALAGVLAVHLGLPQPDLELHRLVVCLAGLGVHVHVGHDVIDQVAPGLNQGAQALDLWVERLTQFGLAMVQAEASRRGVTLQGAGL